jgi:hypothetical protein
MTSGGVAVLVAGGGAGVAVVVSEGGSGVSAATQRHGGGEMEVPGPAAGDTTKKAARAARGSESGSGVTPQSRAGACNIRFRPAAITSQP